jgi:membrane protease YdiL (CAAX protease family)
MYTWDHVIAVIVCIFAPVLAFTARQISSEEIKLESEDKIRLYHSNSLLLIVFALIVATTWRFPHRTLPALGLDRPVWHPYVFIFLFIIFLFYAMDLFFQYGTKKKREKTLSQRHRIFSFIPVDKNEMIHFAFLAIAAGISEEIIFRGYLIHYMVFWTGVTFNGILVACLFSSLLFAFLHGYQGVASMAKIFFIALMFCGVFVFSQSLIIVIVAHALIDIFSGLVGVYLVKGMDQEAEGESEG